MSPYSFFMAALPCVAVLVAMVAGAATYDASRRLKLLKGVAVAALAFWAIAIGLPTFGNYLYEVKHRPQKELEPAALAGVWTTTYQNVGPFHVSGAEPLALKADGTYQQTFRSGSYLYKSPSSPWWIEDGWIIHLMHGRFYLYGVAWAEDLEKGDASIQFTDQIILDGTEIILFVRPDPDTPGQLVLEHLPVGDPDSPDRVQFRRVSTRIPGGNDTP
jgi:hypothetical protein